jgi:hypothetical protein
VKEHIDLDRREFTLQAALAMLSGVAITITACGSTSPVAPGPPPTGDVTGAITSNHGHSAVITRAQLTAGNALQLDIRGSADHTHVVELSQAQLSTIASGREVTVTTTVDDLHSHSVAFN